MSAALIKNMPPDASVNTIRVFEDGDYVFAHTQYNFFGPRIEFDIFRYENSLIVEHWDNLQETATEPSPSGHTMIEQPHPLVSDLDQTQANKGAHATLHGRPSRKAVARPFQATSTESHTSQHNPWVAGAIQDCLRVYRLLPPRGEQSSTSACIWYLVKVISSWSSPEASRLRWRTHWRPVDLFRIEKGRIAEHWDTLEAIPPRDPWKNSNGKF